jgi:hypothetical protein
MSRRVVASVIGAVTAVVAVLAVVYLVVACQSLPGFLGAVPGDTHPRTKLGLALLGVAVVLAVVTLLAARRSDTA